MSKPDIKSIAQHTIALEIDGLKKLSGALDQNFEQAVKRLSEVSGRVIVAGIGKSGHIARKIAATMASTGTPAQFVHPSEAAHGDLGMITQNDAVLALSWSGETAELRPLITYSRRFAILLVALTSQPASALAQAADITIKLPAAEEAGSIGLAPTTSTTIQIVMGDALAIALLETKGFDTNRFRDLHPGGALGAQLKHVGDIMHQGDALPLCDQTTSMAEALLTISAKAMGCIGITNAHGALIGIITDGDLRRHISDNLISKKAADVMTRQPKTIASNMLAPAALDMMQKARITSLFVVDNGKPVGIIHIHDFLRQGIL